MNDIVLRTDRLSRSFGRKEVLCDIGLEVRRGSVCALLGPNGAGKTTLLKLLMGLIQPTSGSCELLGDSGWPRNRASLKSSGFLIDGFEPPRSTRIRHLLQLNRGISGKFDRQRANQLLDRRGLEPSRPWSTLSKGQRRWVLLIMLLCRDCELLLLDEPADGLDPQTRQELYQLIRQEANNRELTALIATHIITDIERVADQVCILNEGSLELQAGLEDLREQVRVIECDEPPPLEQLPSGIELIHQQVGVTVTLWLRDRELQLADREIPFEIGRRSAGLEELFLILTRRELPDSTAIVLAPSEALAI